jgi:hypothetical protein
VGSPDFKQALLERFHGENQMNKEKWTKLIALKNLKWSKSNSRKHHQNSPVTPEKSPTTDPGTFYT